MTKASAEQAVTVSALLVGGIWAYRKVIEPATSQAGKNTASSSQLLKVIGAEPTPANAAQFAVGFGFTYMTLATVATFAPDVAGWLAILVAAGDLLINGASVFTDISSQVGETGPAVTGTVAAGGNKGTAKVGGSTVKITPTGQLHG